MGTAELPILSFASKDAWRKWLSKHHSDSPGAWLQIAKKSSGIASVNYAEALEVALCFGWIDSQKKTYDDLYFLQKFTPRGPKSIWSKVNRDKATALIAAGNMLPPGLRAVNQAKQDGQWDDAYDSQSTATIPTDLQNQLDNSPKAKAFFATLSSANRYAILFRIHHTKQPANRAAKIRKFIAMLEQHETIH